MEGASTQVELGEAWNQLGLCASRGVKQNGARREPAPAPRSPLIDQLSQCVVDLILAHSDDDGVRLGESSGQAAAGGCKSRRPTAVKAEYFHP
jgi:hypothetical protein